VRSRFIIPIGAFPRLDVQSDSRLTHFVALPPSPRRLATAGGPALSLRRSRRVLRPEPRAELPRLAAGAVRVAASTPTLPRAPRRRVTDEKQVGVHGLLPIFA
jgi:hypothetical protein